MNPESDKSVSASTRRSNLYAALFLLFLALTALPAFAGRLRDVPTTDLPCLLPPQTPGVLVLFSGKAEELAQNFTHPDGTAPTWKITEDGSLAAQDADLMSKLAFEDVQIHVEFKIPPAGDAEGQAKSNSGVILHGRFAMQIRDSFGVSQPGAGDCGAVYNLVAPRVNACKAPDTWQSYDIIFRAARFSEDGKTRVQSPCVTAFLNGTLVQNNTEIAGHTEGYTLGDPHKPTPFLLQFNGSAVEFRNVWALPLSRTAQAAPDAPAPDRSQQVVNWQDVPQGEEVAVSRVFFDQGGYQVVCGAGETIVVPFANENTDVMKFGRSNTDSAYFVNDGSAPTLFLSNKGYLENPVAEDARWYPIPADYNYTAPLYVGLAPNWNAYNTMGWYPNMSVYGGVTRSTRNGSYVWMNGYYTDVNGVVYRTYADYLAYMMRKKNFVRNRRVYLNYGIRPTGLWGRSAGRGNVGGGGTSTVRTTPHQAQPVKPGVSPGTPRYNQGAQRTQRSSSVPPPARQTRPNPMNGRPLNSGQMNFRPRNPGGAGGGRPAYSPPPVNNARRGGSTPPGRANGRRR